MIIDRLKELESARARVAELESAHNNALVAELASLPAKYGFENVKTFLRAVRRAVRHGSIRTTGRRRARVTDATRAKVKEMAKAGQPGAKIAKSTGVSLATVHNVKKSLGLVKSRK